MKKNLQKIITIFLFFIIFFSKIFSFLFKIKFGVVDFARIGGIYHLDWYLSEKKMNNIKSLDIFCFSDENKTSNKQWLKMWKKEVILIQLPNIFIRSFYTIRDLNFFDNIIENIHVNLKYPELYEFFETRSASLVKKNNNRLECILNNKKINISFTKSEIDKGKKFLQKIGVKNEKYICIHNRDSKYLNVRFPNSDWTYHDYRDFKVQDFEKTINSLIKKGYYVIRVGSEVEESLKINSSNYFDYSSSSYKSDFLDIFLSSHCFFFISSDSGISAIPEVFKIPVVYINKTVLTEIHRWTSKNIFIFKKFYSNKYKRYLRFEEIWKIKLGNNDHDFQMKLNQIIIENNSPNEIEEVTNEMIDILENNFKYSVNDEKIQQIFWDIFAPNHLRSDFFCRIGKDYLIKNKSLL